MSTALIDHLIDGKVQSPSLVNNQSGSNKQHVWERGQKKMEINNLFGSLTSSECSLSLPELQQGPALTLKQNLPQLSQLVQGRKTVSLQFPFSDDPWINVSPSNHPLHQHTTSL